ncbi:hypothetical protein yc1106_02819 [Curvularia clavata]|uniref:Calpain catalytic domain-containing protein n=1 Tax=Curvularia clavata TaxID=95742 RepID=A0A9Q8Z5I5_CURCL|nr:hypothetical protein yc1106_02819 [Curvularia clavata]
MGTDGDGGNTQVGEPQAAIDEFWDSLITKKPAKVTKIFPQSLYANLLPPQHPVGTVVGKNAAESYQAAAAECRARVKRIVKECHRTNEKFTDPDFDISNLTDKSCLEGLMYWYRDATESPPVTTASELGQALSTIVQSGIILNDGAAIDIKATSKILASLNNSTTSSACPRSVHRVDWIFENPQFVVDGFSGSDLRQGSSGDCWFIAAVSTICTYPALMDKVCVARDEECGVYGFVFYRDGDWVWTVVDDSLYLTNGDFDAEVGDGWDPTNSREAKWKKNYQTGSEALWFASCVKECETWLPLLEKAYAKIHGDYDAISGGFSGEAVEDLTGGVTTKILTNRVLSKEKLWKELLQVGKEFLFSASSPTSSVFGVQSDSLRGLALGHAYSVLKAVEEQDKDGKSHRLVMIRNPWGKKLSAGVGEWTGPWSDGSREWTPYWLDKLDHKFGDDGLFWMSYEDLLKRFDLLDRTRLFDEQWTVVQRWTSVSVAWVTGYLNTKFSVEIKKAGPTVFVLCQLDERYFQGLQGKYTFDLHFVLQEKNAKAGEHLVRARGAWFGNRSVAAEVDLEAGVYEVVPKIVATRDSDVPEAIDVVKKLAMRNPQKLRQIGMNYDMANAKGVVELPEEEKEKKVKENEAEGNKAGEKGKTESEAQRKEEGASDVVAKQHKQAEEKKESDQDAGSKQQTKDSDTQKEQSDTPRNANANTEQQPDTDITTLAAKAQAQAPTSDSDLTKLLLLLTEHILRPPATTTDTPELPSADLATTTDAPPAPDTSDDTPTTTSDKDKDKNQKSWNAVCTLGLRVYSLDPSVTIQLIRPQSVAETSILDVDGATQAGATM